MAVDIAAVGLGRTAVALAAETVGAGVVVELNASVAPAAGDVTGAAAHPVSSTVKMDIAATFMNIAASSALKPRRTSQQVCRGSTTR
jgi:hypothetical protein